MASDKFTNFQPGRIHLWEKEITTSLEQKTARGVWRVRAYESVGSTMDEARQLASDLPVGTCGFVITQEQSQGRGRQGRVWQESHSGFYGTYVFKSTASLENFFCLPLVVGLSISELFAGIHLDCSIKWPNDVLSLAGKKLSGILIEYLKGNDSHVFLVGVGINLKGEPSSESRAVSVFTEIGRVYSPQFIAAELGERLLNNFREVEAHGFLNFREAWLLKTRGVGAPLSVHVGSEIVSGVFRGVGPLGYLLLEVDGAIKEISSGELIQDLG